MPTGKSLPRNSEAVLRIAIVEDESLYRELLAEALDKGDDLSVVGRFSDPQAALAEIPALAPRVAVLDIELGREMNGIELGLALRRKIPNLGIVLLSNHRVSGLLNAIPPQAIAGWSYLLKSSVRDLEALRRAVRGAADGFVVLDHELLQAAPDPSASALARFSPRQQQILKLMAEGWSNPGIANRLSLSLKTIENQVNLIYQALEIDRRDGRLQPRVIAVLEYLRAAKLL